MGSFGNKAVKVTFASVQLYVPGLVKDSKIIHLFRGAWCFKRIEVIISKLVFQYQENTGRAIFSGCAHIAVEH
jgi:hypothetical protein